MTSALRTAHIVMLASVLNGCLLNDDKSTSEISQVTIRAIVLGQDGTAHIQICSHGGARRVRRSFRLQGAIGWIRSANAACQRGARQVRLLRTGPGLRSRPHRDRHLCSHDADAQPDNDLHRCQQGINLTRTSAVANRSSMRHAALERKGQ